MSGQTTYDINTANAVPGQVADIGHNEIDSFLAEGAAGIGFGLVVSRGTNDGQAIIGGDATGIGVTVRDLAREGAANTGVVAYAEKETMAVMRFGSGSKIFATIPTGGSAGDVLNYNDTTGVIDAGVAVAGETDIAGATLEEDVDAGKVGKIRLG